MYSKKEKKQILIRGSLLLLFWGLLFLGIFHLRDTTHEFTLLNYSGIQTNAFEFCPMQPADKLSEEDKKKQSIQVVVEKALTTETLSRYFSEKELAVTGAKGEKNTNLHDFFQCQKRERQDKGEKHFGNLDQEWGKTQLQRYSLIVPCIADSLLKKPDESMDFEAWDKAWDDAYKKIEKNSKLGKLRVEKNVVKLHDLVIICILRKAGKLTDAVEVWEAFVKSPVGNDELKAKKTVELCKTSSVIGITEGTKRVSDALRSNGYHVVDNDSAGSMVALHTSRWEAPTSIQWQATLGNRYNELFTRKLAQRQEEYVAALSQDKKTGQEYLFIVLHAKGKGTTAMEEIALVKGIIEILEKEKPRLKIWLGHDANTGDQGEGKPQKADPVAYKAGLTKAGLTL